MKQSSRNKDRKGAGMTQQGERSPPTNVARIRFRSCVICGLCLLLVLVLLRGFFLQDLRFSSHHKNHHSKFNTYDRYHSFA